MMYDIYRGDTCVAPRHDYELARAALKDIVTTQVFKGQHAVGNKSSIYITSPSDAIIAITVARSGDTKRIPLDVFRYDKPSNSRREKFELLENATEIASFWDADSALDALGDVIMRAVVRRCEVAPVLLLSGYFILVDDMDGSTKYKIRERAETPHACIDQPTKEKNNG